MAGEAENAAEKKRFTRRALIVGGVQACGLILIGARLYQLQVMENRKYAPLADDNRISQRGLVPRRGRILDRNGRVLAFNEESFRLSILPGPAPEMRRTLAALRRTLPLTPEEVHRIVGRARDGARSRPITIRSGLSFDDVARISVLSPHLPGVETDVEHRRRYNDGPVIGHVVGYVGGLDRRALDDDPFLRLPNVRVGKAGVELGMDVELRGHAGSQKFEVDARGRIVRHLDEMPPSEGADVAITIDTTLQERVLERLSREPRAALVALDVDTGEVLVMASVPTFDPNDLTVNFSDESWKGLQADDHNPLLNRTIGGLYPPGSTFKMVTALAALEAGAVTLDERISCSGAYELADQTFRCWRRDGHGMSDLARALKESCDVYFYELAARIGVDRIASMARRLGLGQIFACGLALQKAGIIPDTGWKRARLGKSWLRGETILAGIGQGYVLTTPLQLAVMTARLATGRAVVPTLVRRLGEPRPDQPVFPALDVSAIWLDAIRTAMVGVVHEAGGTGLSADAAAGAVLIAGKTGTSQVRSTTEADRTGAEPSWNHRDHALFVSYFPANAPRYAISVVVEHGGGGGVTAAPIVRDVIRMLLSFEARDGVSAAGLAVSPVNGATPDPTQAGAP